MSIIIRALYESLYSRKFYREVATLEKGSGIKFITFLSFIAALTYSIIVFAAMQTAEYAQFKKELIDQTPVTTFTAEGISIDRPSPYYLTFFGEKGGVIDTSGTFDNMSTDQVQDRMDREGIKLVVTKTRLYAIKSDNEMRTYDLTGNKDKMTFDSTDVSNFMNKVPYFTVPIIFITMFIVMFIYKMIQLIIYSLVALIANSFGARYEYPTLLRLTAYALWPSGLVAIISHFTGFQLWTLTYIVLTIIYVVFAVRSAKKPVIVQA